MSDQTPATPVEAVSVEPVVETPIVEEAPVVPAEPVKVVEDEDLGFDDDSSAAAKYWKSMSRKNEAEKKKALEQVKLLTAEKEALNSELGAIKHETNVASVLSEYGLPEGTRVLLHGTDVDSLKAQAAALVALTGGKVPTPAPAPAPVAPAAQAVDLNDGIPDVTAVVTPRVINPLAGMSDNKAPQATSFGARIKSRLNDQ